MSVTNAAVVVGVIAATRLKLGDRLYEPGDALELPRDDELARLLDGGAVELATDAGANAGGGGGGNGMTVAEAIVALAAGVAAGDISDEAAYTKSGKPDCNALEGIIKRELSAAERDEAWEQVQQSGDGGAGGGSQE